MGSLGGGTGPRVGGFGPLPQSQGCLGNSEGLSTSNAGWGCGAGYQGAHWALVLPYCQTLAKVLTSPPPPFSPMPWGLALPPQLPRGRLSRG